MNSFKKITFLLAFFIVLSCKNEETIINEKGVLNLFIGDNIPNKLENFEAIKSVKIVEGGNEEPIVRVLEKNEELLQISFQYDANENDYINKISELLITNKKFKTDKNIGVESTISEFINSYPNYQIWHTYISNRFIIQSKESTIQFILDHNGFIGKKDLLESDRVELKKEDFLSNTKIIEIRIF